MKAIKGIPPVVLLVGVALLGLGVYVWRKGGAGPAGEGAGRAIVDGAAGVGVGVVKGIGQIVGIPDTSESECESAKRSGDLWRASFVCPATDFAAQAWRRVRTPAIDESILDPRDAMARRPAGGEARAHVCLPGECGTERRGTGAGTNQTEPVPPWDGTVRAGETWFGVP